MGNCLSSRREDVHDLDPRREQVNRTAGSQACPASDESVQVLNRTNERTQRRTRRPQVQEARGSSYSPTPPQGQIHTQNSYYYETPTFVKGEKKKRATEVDQPGCRKYLLKKTGDNCLDLFRRYCRWDLFRPQQSPIWALPVHKVDPPPFLVVERLEETEDLLMRHERYRYASFAEHPHFPDHFLWRDMPSNLANDGYWFDSSNGRIECFECCHEVTLGSLQPRPHYNLCNRHILNVPFADTNPRPIRTAHLYQRMGLRNPAGQPRQSQPGVRQDRFQRPGGYEDRDARFDSIRRLFPQQQQQQPQKFADFADAGFYAVDANTAACYLCGIQVHPARLQNDAFAAHSQLNPECAFIRSRYMYQVPFCEHGRCLDRNFHRYGFLGGAHEHPEGSQWARSTSGMPAGRPQTRGAPDRGMCNICNSNRACVMAEPCGHLYACRNCAPDLRDCPVCGNRIHTARRVYPE